MADVEVTVTVHGKDDVMSALDPSSWELWIEKHPGACDACRYNTDPEQVPLHPRCRCKVVLVQTS